LDKKYKILQENQATKPTKILLNLASLIL